MTFDFIELAKQFGPFVAFTAYFVWQGWQREKKLTSRIDELSNKMNDVLGKTVSDATLALNSSTKVMERLEELLQKHLPE
jgi:hypothetical protein